MAKMVDARQAQEAISDDDVEVQYAEVALVLTVETTSDDIHSQSENSIKFEHVPWAHVLFEPGNYLGDMFVNSGFEKYGFG